ncbi:MAG: CPBP family intramembrane metalloprotease, partial [Chloroflexota bacterium]|nr:CPBP family intramembrane metalloprotease [Chloroflexota bacterium]
AALYLLIVLPFVTVGWVAPEGGPAGQQGMAALGGVLLALLGFVVQASTEEIIFRGWLLPVVAARSRVWIGVAVSALIFAVLHFYNTPFTPQYLVQLLLAGVFLALWALWESGLWGVCAFHVAINWIQENALGLGAVTAPDGAVEGGVLVNLRETAAGPDLLTGGALGLEDSLVLSLLLAAGSVVLAGLLQRRVAAPGPEAG